MEGTPRPDDDELIVTLDENSNGYLVNGKCLGHVDKKMLKVLRVRLGLDDPAELPPGYYYDQDTGNVYNVPPEASQPR